MRGNFVWGSCFVVNQFHCHEPLNSKNNVPLISTSLRKQHSARVIMQGAEVEDDNNVRSISLIKTKDIEERFRLHSGFEVIWR